MDEKRLPDNLISYLNENKIHNTSDGFLVASGLSCDDARKRLELLSDELRRIGICAKPIYSSDWVCILPTSRYGNFYINDIRS